MTKLESAETFRTSWGTTFIVEAATDLKLGQDIIINGGKYRIKKILFPPKPDDERVAIIVED